MTTNRVTEEPGEAKVSRPVLQGGGGWQRPSPTQRLEAQGAREVSEQDGPHPDVEAEAEERGEDHAEMELGTRRARGDGGRGREHRHSGSLLYG